MNNLFKGRQVVLNIFNKKSVCKFNCISTLLGYLMPKLSL